MKTAYKTIEDNFKGEATTDRETLWEIVQKKYDPKTYPYAYVSSCREAWRELNESGENLSESFLIRILVGNISERFPEIIGSYGRCIEPKMLWFKAELDYELSTKTRRNILKQLNRK